MHKAQLDLVLNAVAIMLCVLAYDIVRLGKEREQHRFHLQWHRTHGSKDVPIADLVNEDPLRG